MPLLRPGDSRKPDRIYQSVTLAVKPTAGLSNGNRYTMREAVCAKFHKNSTVRLPGQRPILVFAMRLMASLDASSDLFDVVLRARLWRTNAGLFLQATLGSAACGKSEWLEPAGASERGPGVGRAERVPGSRTESIKARGMSPTQLAVWGGPGEAHCGPPTVPAWSYSCRWRELGHRLRGAITHCRTCRRNRRRLPLAARGGPCQHFLA